MIKEDRYIVLKRSDLQFINPDVLRDFMWALERVNRCNTRTLYRKFVVVESDWPEYDVVWKMIEERVDK